MADDQCIPFYEQHEYFIFDREDLHRISETSAGERESVISLQGMTVDIFMSDPSTHVDILFWGSFTTLMVLVFLLGMCCFYCCIWCLCVEDPTQRRKKQSPVLGLVFGTLTIAMILMDVIIVALLFWFEIRLNDQSKAHMNTTQLYIRDNVVPDDVVIVERWTNLFFTVQVYRYWISIIYLGTLLLVMLMTTLVICFCARHYKAAFLVILLGLITGLVVIGSLVSGTAFVGLMYFSIMCYDLSRLSGSSQCSTEANNNPLLASLLKLCGEDVFIPLYVVTGLLMLHLVGLFLVQCFGTVLIAYVHKLNEQHSSNKRRQSHQNNDGTSSPAGQPENTIQNTAVRIEHRTSIMSAPTPSHGQPFHFSNVRAWSSSEIPRSFSRMTSFPANGPTITEGMPMHTIPSLPEDGPPDYDEVMRGDYPRTAVMKLFSNTGTENDSSSQEPNDNGRAEFEIVEDSADSTDSNSTQ